MKRFFQISRLPGMCGLPFGSSRSRCVNSMAVTFDGGQGPKPVAGNVLLASDTDTVDTITATVTVPYKKNIGRNPVWNVRVGSGGALSKGFTVTP